MPGLKLHPPALLADGECDHTMQSWPIKSKWKLLDEISENAFLKWKANLADLAFYFSLQLDLKCNTGAWATILQLQRKKHMLRMAELRKKSKPDSLRTLSVQFSSIAQLCPALCDPMDYSTPGLPVHHQLPELTQTHVH